MNGKLDLQPAQPSDFMQVQEILSEAAHWMRTELGVLDQWPERFPDWIVEKAIAANEMYLVRVDEEVVGTVRIQNADEGTWGEDAAPAVYVHSLALRRTQAGKGLGGAMLDKVQADAASA